VAQVLYPGLPEPPGHEVAAKQMRRFGGMVSFRASAARGRGGDLQPAKLFVLGESLGGVESLIEHPARMTHASRAGSPLEVPATWSGSRSGSRPSTTSSATWSRPCADPPWPGPRRERGLCMVRKRMEGHLPCTPVVGPGRGGEAMWVGASAERIAAAVQS
jgi:hypothetical protein